MFASLSSNQTTVHLPLCSNIYGEYTKTVQSNLRCSVSNLRLYTSNLFVILHCSMKAESVVFMEFKKKQKTLSWTQGNNIHGNCIGSG